MEQAASSSPTQHHGSCACGEVRFEAQLDLARGASRCNCRLCIKLHQTGAKVKPSEFRVTEGEDSLVTFQRTTYPMFRRFCSTCGTQVYGYGDIPEMGGAFVSVNVQCLDDVEVAEIPVRYFDGRHDNWMAGTRETPWPIFTQA